MKLIKSVVLGVDAAAAVSGFVRSTVWNGSAAAFNGVASRDALCPPFAAQKPSPSLTAPCKAASAGGGVRGRSLLFVQPIAHAPAVEKQGGNKIKSISYRPRPPCYVCASQLS